MVFSFQLSKCLPTTIWNIMKLKLFQIWLSHLQIDMTR